MILTKKKYTIPFYFSTHINRNKSKDLLKSHLRVLIYRKQSFLSKIGFKIGNNHKLILSLQKFCFQSFIFRLHAIFCFLVLSKSKIQVELLKNWKKKHIMQNFTISIFLWNTFFLQC